MWVDHQEYTLIPYSFLGVTQKGVVLLLVLLFSCVYSSCQDVFLPYERGNHSTTRVHIGSLLTIGLEENLDVWLPTEGGTYSVYYFLDGMGGAIPADLYSQVRGIHRCLYGDGHSEVGGIHGGIFK